ncbi:MAG: restriction endonuclease [Gaiellaceae bacterium]
MVAAAKFSSPDPFGTLIHGLVTLWPLWVLVALVGAGKLGLHLYEMRRLSRSGIADVDRMDGETFEHFLTTLFRRLGYGVEHTGRRGDFGADLVVTKNGRRVAVQAKRWSKVVGVKAVQEAVAAKGMYRCTESLVVANRPFTRQARTLAQANDVTLWDREVLVAKLLVVGNEAAEAAPSDVALTLAGISRCASCGVEVSNKVRDYCLARRHRFSGRIYCFTHQRVSD